MQRTFFGGEDSIFGGEDSIFCDEDAGFNEQYPLDDDEFVSALFGGVNESLPSLASNSIPIDNPLSLPQGENVKKRQLDEQSEIDDESRKKRKLEVAGQVIPSPVNNYVVRAPSSQEKPEKSMQTDEQKKIRNEQVRKYKQSLVYADVPTRNAAERQAALVGDNARIEYDAKGKPFVNRRPVITIDQSYRKANNLLINSVKFFFKNTGFPVPQSKITLEAKNARIVDNQIIITEDAFLKRHAFINTVEGVERELTRAEKKDLEYSGLEKKYYFDNIEVTFKSKHEKKEITEIIDRATNPDDSTEGHPHLIARKNLFNPMLNKKKEVEIINIDAAVNLDDAIEGRPPLIARENPARQNVMDKIVLGPYLYLSLPCVTAEMLPQVQYHLNEIEKLCSYYMMQQQRQFGNFYSPTLFNPRQGTTYPPQAQQGATYPLQAQQEFSDLPSGLPRR